MPGPKFDYAELANLVDGIDTETAATVLQHIDQHYHSGQSRPQWISTQLVRRLPIPIPQTSMTTTGGPGRRSRRVAEDQQRAAWLWQ